MSPPRTCLEPGRRVRSARCVTADTHRTSFDRVAHCYDETRALPAEVMAAVVARIADELGPITSSPLLLEVGVGTGRIAVPLADAGVRVVGIDIAPAMLARLHGRRPGLPVLRADAARLPFRTATFVATLFVHVLHLLPDPAATLRAARRVTQPNGVLLYGRTDFTNAPLEPVAAIVRELVAELAGVELDPGRRASALPGRSRRMRGWLVSSSGRPSWRDGRCAWSAAGCSRTSPAACGRARGTSPTPSCRS